MALDPSTFAPQGESSVPFNDFVGAYDEAIRRADAQVVYAKGRVQSARAQLAAIPPGITHDDDRKAAETEAAKAETTLEAATKETVDAGARKAQAIERYSQRSNIAPELRDRYAAMADAERASVQQKQAENFEFLNAIPEKRAQLHATTLETQANAAVAQAKADVAAATTDIEKQSAQTRLDQANASLQSTQLANTRAGLENKVAAATAAVAPRVAEAGAATAESKAKEAAAAAGVAPDMAQAALSKAQSDATAAQLAVQSTQAQLDATTDADRRRAIQLDLSQKQAALDAANQQLDAARQLLPLSVRQATATAAETEATTQKGLLGTFYGLPDRIKAIADAYRSGNITDPAEMERQLQAYLNTAVAGTTPFEAQKTALDAESTRRGQDYSLAGTQMSTLGSVGNSLFNSLASQNKDAPAGSTAMATAYGGVMGAMMNAFQGMRPNIPMDSPLVRSIAGLGGVNMPGGAAAVPAPAAAPTTTIQPDGTVQITHVATQPTAAGLLPPGMAGTGADPMVSGSPALPPMLMGNQLAGPQHVNNLWDQDPNLHPELSGDNPAVTGRTAAGVE